MRGHAEGIGYDLSSQLFQKLVSKTELLLEKYDLSVNLLEIIRLIDGRIELVGKERR